MLNDGITQKQREDMYNSYKLQAYVHVDRSGKRQKRKKSSYKEDNYKRKMRKKQIGTNCFYQSDQNILDYKSYTTFFIS
jgi:hypothetical protein